MESQLREEICAGCRLPAIQLLSNAFELDLLLKSILTRQLFSLFSDDLRFQRAAITIHSIVEINLFNKRTHIKLNNDGFLIERLDFKARIFGTAHHSS